MFNYSQIKEFSEELLKPEDKTTELSKEVHALNTLMKVKFEDKNAKFLFHFCNEQTPETE